MLSACFRRNGDGQWGRPGDAHELSRRHGRQGVQFPAADPDVKEPWAVDLSPRPEHPRPPSPSPILRAFHLALKLAQPAQRRGGDSVGKCVQREEETTRRAGGCKPTPPGHLPHSVRGKWLSAGLTSPDVWAPDYNPMLAPRPCTGQRHSPHARHRDAPFRDRPRTFHPVQRRRLIEPSDQDRTPSDLHRPAAMP